MDICYVINNNKKFVDILRVSIASVLEHNDKHIRFYILFDSLSENEIESLRSMINATNSEIHFIDAGFRTDTLHLNTRWPNIVNVRLFLKEFLPDDVDKILYLDSDTLILDSLDDLFDIDLNDKAVAVVADTIRASFKEQLGLGKDDPYFNSGVMLINVKRYARLINETAIKQVLEEYGTYIKYPDQDLLNCCLIKNCEYLILPLKYNMLPPYFMFEYQWLIKYKECDSWKYDANEYNDSVGNPLIIHFAGSYCYSRPWTKKCKHPYAGRFNEISVNVNGDKLVYPDDRNFRQKFQAAICRWIPDKIVIPLICRMKRVYEKD